MDDDQDAGLPSPTEVEDVIAQSGLVGDVVAWGSRTGPGQAVHVAVTYLPHAEPAALGMYCARAPWPLHGAALFYSWDGAMPRTGSGKLDRPKIIVAAGSRRAA